FLAGVTTAPRLLLDDVPFHLYDRFGVEAPPHRWQFHFVEHHIAHAASAFLPSPFERAAILTLDGAGEKATTMMGVGRGLEMEKLQEVELPNSLGKLYEVVTWYLGFMNNSDEYKVMALASYGQPRFADAFRSLVRWSGDGRYEIDQDGLDELCGPRRRPRAPLEPRHFDLAA